MEQGDDRRRGQRPGMLSRHGTEWSPQVRYGAICCSVCSVCRYIVGWKMRLEERRKVTARPSACYALQLACLVARRSIVRARWVVALGPLCAI